MHIYLKNNCAKFHLDLIWNNGALLFFKEHPQQEEEKKKKKKMSKRPVHDPKTPNLHNLGIKYQDWA